jgi:hypothetical protein
MRVRSCGEGELRPRNVGWRRYTASGWTRRVGPLVGDAVCATSIPAKATGWRSLARPSVALADQLSDLGFAVQGFVDGAALLGALDPAIEADVISRRYGDCRQTSGLFVTGFVTLRSGTCRQLVDRPSARPTPN